MIKYIQSPQQRRTILWNYSFAGSGGQEAGTIFFVVKRIWPILVFNNSGN